MIRVELPARPLDRQRRLVVHALRHADRGAVVIAEQRDRAARDEILHGVDREARIGAVADVVAEEDMAIDRMPLRMREAGFERLAVAVDVGEQGDQHCTGSALKREPSRSRSARSRNKTSPDPDQWVRAGVASAAGLRGVGVYCFWVGGGAPIGRVAGAWLLTGRGGV